MNKVLVSYYDISNVDTSQIESIAKLEVAKSGVKLNDKGKKKSKKTSKSI